MSSASLIERVLAGDVTAVARAMSLVEDAGASAVDVMRAVHTHTGRAYLVGITGPPGAGKSTLVDRLISEMRQDGKTVGVIAVDPTSPFTGGAVLGDRVRMGRHAADSGVFIRSMATRGQLGGVARATSDAASILDASGKDVVIIETVGVGQDEVDVAKTADVCIVMLVPGLGDDIQAGKAGIMEIADIFVVNKSDREGADRLVQSIAGQLSLQPVNPAAERPSILKTVATTGEGIPELSAAITQFRARSTERSDRRARARHELRLREVVSHQLMEYFERALPAGELDRIVDRINSREIDPYSAAADLIHRAGMNHPTARN